MGRAGSGPKFHVNSGSGWVTLFVGRIGSGQENWTHVQLCTWHYWRLLDFTWLNSHSRVGLAVVLHVWLLLKPCCQRCIICLSVCSCGVAEESVKYCAADGNWFTKNSLEWTDYTPCVDIQVLRQIRSYYRSMPFCPSVRLCACLPVCRTRALYQNIVEQFFTFYILVFVKTNTLAKKFWRSHLCRIIKYRWGTKKFQIFDQYIVTTSRKPDIAILSSEMPYKQRVIA